MLTHSPDVVPDLPANLPLVLARHTHCGQVVLPWIGPLLMRAPKDHWRQLYNPRYRCGIVRDGARTTIITADVGSGTSPVTTSIRATKRRQKAGFNWLDSWTFDTDADTEQSRGMTLTLSDWVYEGIINEKSLLTMHPDYFLLSGGLERALYRIARKHVGSQRGGWLCRVEVLRDKTGSGSQPKEFKRILRRVIEADQLPEYAMELAETADRSPAVQFRRRGEAEAMALAEKMRAGPATRPIASMPTR